MEKLIDKYRGIIPGAIIDRELKKQKLRQSAFAKAIDVPAQTLNAIIKGKRRMTPEVALKIDHAFGFEASTMGVLQAYYDTKLAMRKTNLLPRPDLSKIRRILFWDTDFDKIDWQNQEIAIVQRVFERGNKEEKDEITRFYGAARVNAILAKRRQVRSHPSAIHQRTK